MSLNKPSPPVQSLHGATLDSPLTVGTTARPLRLLRLQDVMVRTGLGKSTLYALMQSGDLPPSVHLSRRAVAWHEQDIERFILERVRSKVQPGGFVPPLPAQISDNLGRIVQGGVR